MTAGQYVKTAVYIGLMWQLCMTAGILMMSVCKDCRLHRSNVAIVVDGWYTNDVSIPRLTSTQV